MAARGAVDAAASCYCVYGDRGVGAWWEPRGQTRVGGGRARARSSCVGSQGVVALQK